MAKNDLVVGAWRNGLDPHVTGHLVKEAEKQRAAGFRLLPYISTVMELADLLDMYDEWAGDTLTTEEVMRGDELDNAVEDIEVSPLRHATTKKKK